MAPSPIVNVARYSALIGGIGYGIVHKRTLQKREDKKAVTAAQRHAEQQAEQAKKQQEQSILAAMRGAGVGGVVSDPESPNFDLEKYLESVDK